MRTRLFEKDQTMPEAKTNLSLQEINVLETALELASANILTTIRHLERLGETKAADALRLTQNFIAPARELLNLFGVYDGPLGG
jgi:hypothetical protein